MSAKLNMASSMLKFTSIVTRTVRIIITGVFVAGASSMVAAQTDEDSASVYEFVDAYQHTIGTHDPAALAAFFTEDADLVMYSLPEIQGRQEIENWWRDYWLSRFNRQEPGRRGTFNLNSVRFFGNDVALINVESTTGGRDSSGVELDTRKARGTWLLQRQNGNWLISAMRGMPTEKDSIILGSSIETAGSLHPYIRAFVDAYEDAFNSHDPAAVSAFFRYDADIIVRNGPLIQGKQAIQECWSAYFSNPRNYRAIFIIDEIRTISDYVVQVDVTVTGAFPEKEDKPQPPRQTRAMWVLVQESGGWRIAALRVLPGEDDRVIRTGGN
jgi:uncharacterized protein (TIGR02246 family)